MKYLLLITIILLESFLLYRGERRIFGHILINFGKLPAYILIAPGIILHELSHLVTCLCLGVQVGKVSLFKPVERDDGSIGLGYVSYVETGMVRDTFIAIAPLLLIPPFLLGIVSLIFGSNVLTDPIGAFAGASWWQWIIVVYILASSAQATFPSIEDHISIAGYIVLGITFIFFCLLIFNDSSIIVGYYVALLFAPSALISGLFLLWFEYISPRKQAKKPEK